MNGRGGFSELSEVRISEGASIFEFGSCDSRVVILVVSLWSISEMSVVMISCLDVLASLSDLIVDSCSSCFLVKLSIIVCILLTCDLSLMVSSD